MKDELDARERQGELRGQKRGEMRGIQSLIEACKDLGASWETVLGMVIDKFLLQRMKPRSICTYTGKAGDTYGKRNTWLSEKVNSTVKEYISK